MLQNLLESGSCIKVIAGAGNTNKDYVRKLIEVYLLAGVRYFDVAADLNIIRDVKNLFTKYNVEGYLAVSYGINDDPHVRKIQVNPDLCIGCGMCKSKCEQEALWHEGLNHTMQVKEDHCIGCGKCLPKCGYGALTLISKPKNISETLPDIVKIGIDTVEFHVSGIKDVEEVYNKWEEISSIYPGMLSLCIDRSKHSDVALKEKIQKLIANRPPYTTIIQADGMPMSGTDESPTGTLQAIAIAQIVERMKLPVYVLMSGGTNKFTTKYAKELEVKYDGVSFGSCARKVVKKYIEDPEFDANLDIKNKAVLVAKEFIEEVWRHMQ